MPEFYVAIVQEVHEIVKVEAPTETDAVTAARMLIADDLNNAGTWKPSDIDAQTVSPQGFDQSIVVTQAGSDEDWPHFDYATDDPNQGAGEGDAGD
jgi:hypothetical protein